MAQKTLKKTRYFPRVQSITLLKHSNTYQRTTKRSRLFTGAIKIFSTKTVNNVQVKKKVRLLLRKLGTTEHNRFVDFILPKKTTDLDFSETIKLLLELFGPNTTLFHKRWKCLKTVKDNQQDFLTFAASVNKLCNDFKQVELTADDLKCLIFAQGLVSAEDAEVRRRVLTKLENEQGLTLQKLSEDCERVISVKCDSKTIEESGVAQIREIRSKSTPYSPKKKQKANLTC